MDIEREVTKFTPLALNGVSSRSGNWKKNVKAPELSLAIDVRGIASLLHQLASL